MEQKHDHVHALPDVVVGNRVRLQYQPALKALADDVWEVHQVQADKILVRSQGGDSLTHGIQLFSLYTN